MGCEKPRHRYADIAPAPGEYTEKVLFGDLWKRPGLAPRDRSLLTVAALVALFRTHEPHFHLAKALESGVTKDEPTEVVTYLASDAGWPADNTAVSVARKVSAQDRPHHRRPARLKQEEAPWLVPGGSERPCRRFRQLCCSPD